MSQGAMDGGVTIPWKGGMSQGAMDGGVTIPWKGGMSQGARGGRCDDPMEGRTDICSCNICISTIHGGHMSQGARIGAYFYHFKLTL